ncbi:hypothetical protein Q73_03970 [Bacillus coahuilensis m2-6]|uniref:hypothetical protein n=1 Tax=Bacillus coahuilensis TaxID=408580 RepID=UPI0007500E73|nr:hypothetical protein [Bacillus coahuilensis]KUP09067.1 hypothetical protein Q73_03970 [Bacillus coahuilensis m2-6]
MRNRTFQLEKEWCRILYPKKPNGFAVLIIADQNHYVDQNTDFWTEHISRQQLVEDLLSKGYYIFYSNLYGNHWGSPKAISLLKLLIHHVKKSEIINNRIHIIAEGMGSITVEKLTKTSAKDIRSIVFINPCLSLKEHIQQEEEKKFFQKKLMKELSQSYEFDEKHYEAFKNGLKENPFYLESLKVPICFIHWIGSTRYISQDLLIKNIYNRRVEGEYQTKMVYVLPEKRFTSNQMIVSFLEEYEGEL